MPVSCRVNPDSYHFHGLISKRTLSTTKTVAARVSGESSIPATLVISGQATRCTQAARIETGGRVSAKSSRPRAQTRFPAVQQKRYSDIPVLARKFTIRETQRTRRGRKRIGKRNGLHSLDVSCRLHNSHRERRLVPFPYLFRLKTGRTLKNVQRLRPRLKAKRAKWRNGTVAILPGQRCRF